MMDTKRSRDTYSVRCPGDVWDAARERAEADGKTINAVVRLLIEGYADGQINTPRLIKVYDDGRERVSA